MLAFWHDSTGREILTIFGWGSALEFLRQCRFFRRSQTTVECTRGMPRQGSAHLRLLLTSERAIYRTAENEMRSWPMIYPKHSGGIDENKALIATLKVGGGHPEIDGE